MTTIGVFGPAEDDEVRVLAERIRARGAEPWIVDLTGLPTALRLRWSAQGIWLDDRSLTDMDAAYLRRVGTRLPPDLRYLNEAPAGDDRPGRHPAAVRALRSERASLALRTAVVQWLSRVRPVINPPREQNLHRLKTHALDRLRQQGLPVPAFVAGTAPAPLRAWAEDASARGAGVVDKPLAGIYKTQRYSTEMVAAHPWGARPALYQRFIDGDTVRCYVLDGRLVSAAKIVHRGTVDSSVSQTGIEVLALPPAAVTIAEATARALGLAFCGMDLMREEATGAWFVIDCNMSPMFVRYGQLSRCDIAAHLAELLIARGRRQEGVRRPRALDLMADAKSLLADDPDIARLLGGAPNKRPPRKP